MRFAIYGSGGLGGYYGARLAEHGHEVGFVARGAHLNAIKQHGLKVLSPLGDVHLRAPNATDDPREVGEVDVVLVAVKTWQVPEVAKAMAPMVGASTVVVPFLNGVEAATELAAVLGEAKVLGGLSKIFSMIESPGVIRHFSPGAYIEVGELNARTSSRVAALCDAFAAAGIEAQVSPDIGTSLWKKLLMVSSWSGIGALARSPIGIVRARADLRSMVNDALLEGIDVGMARGHAIDRCVAKELWGFYDGLPDDATSSMLRDIVAGKPSELDAWNGAVVRFGAKHDVPTPVHAMTYALLSPMERRARGQSELS